MCVSPRTAQAEEPSEQGEGGDDEDQAWFVCPFGVCSDFASKAARKDVEEQAASADSPPGRRCPQGLRACCWFALLLFEDPIADCGLCPCWCRTSRCSKQLWRTRLRSKPQPDVFGKHGGKSTGKHPCTRQDLAQAQQVLLDVLQKQLQMAANTTATVQNRWQKEFNAQNDQEAGALWEQLVEANQQVDKAMQKLEAARASVQAGRGQAGLLHVQLLLLPLICTPAWSSFPCGPPCFAFWGHALISARIPSSSSCLHCVHWGLFGLEGLLAASGFTKKNVAAPVLLRGKGMLRKSFCTSCFADASERGCQSEARGWGVSLFSARFDRVMVLAVRVCVALRLQLFLRMRFRLLYLCLRAWPPCCRKCRWCCCLSRCVGVGQGPRSPPAFCRAAGHRAPGGKLHVSLCRCSAFALSANASL